MSRHVIPFFLLLAVFIGIFFVSVNTSWVSNRYGAEWLQEQIPGLEVDSFYVTRQQFIWPDRLRMFGVTADCRYQKKDIHFQAIEVIVKGTLKSLGQKEPVRLQISGAQVKTDTLELRDAKLDLIFPIKVLRTKIFEGKGMLIVRKLNFYHYEAEDISIRFGVNQDQLQVFEATAAVYGGKFQSGQVSFQFKPGALYISWSELTGLDAEKLSRLNQILFSGLSGIVNGTWRLVGDLYKVEVLAIMLSMSEGGTMSPALLDRLIANMREGVSREQLRSLRQTGKLFVFDKANLYIQNIDSSTLALIVEIEDKILDLHIQERIIVTAPEGLRALILKNPNSAP